LLPARFWKRGALQAEILYPSIMLALEVASPLQSYVSPLINPFSANAARSSLARVMTLARSVAAS